MMTTALCTDVDDPLQRLREVHEQALNAKAYMQAQGSRMMVDFRRRSRPACRRC